ncbi:MAG: hypothetical protein IPO12_15135 [Flavobacteriales bacterium]|nr:hypothetical protein [Flavobacteriales bacterium]
MASGIGPRSHLLTVLLLSGTIVLGQGAVPDSFKRAVAAGHYRVALKLVAADKDTTGLLPGYLDAETKAVVKEAMGVSAAPCAATILRALYARTLLDYSSQESGTTRAVASLAEHTLLIQSADPHAFPRYRTLCSWT